MHSNNFKFKILNFKNNNYLASSIYHLVSKQNGQSLMEAVVVVAVGVIVMGSLVFATIASLRNAQFSKNQSMATKFAQDALEQVRNLRNRDGDITTTIPDPANPGSPINKFSALWTVDLSHEHCNTTKGDAPCYFKFISGDLTQNNSSSINEDLNNGAFLRQVTIGDDVSSYTDEKTVTVIVKWTDFSGSHESKLVTILSNPG